MLRSTTVPERNRGRSPCITARVFLVFVKKEYALFVNHWRSLCVLCGFARKNHPRGNRMVIPHHLRCNSLFISPAVGRMGINPTPTVAECSNVLIISVLHVLFLYEVNMVAKCSNVLIISVLHVLFLHEEAVCCNRAVPHIR